ncbi:MAG: hypothetical protein E6H08_15220 [Bacteroidetes bacterium]|nr:MAG: hypothetical protein E6H08_15220 [Bacteroidota bacterium]
MKTILFILLSIAVINSAQAQIDSYQITNSDTIELADLSFKRAVALHFDEATILLDHDLFMKHLTSERKGLKKQIKSLERMIKRGTDNPGVTSSQLKSYQRQFAPVDSVFAIVKQSRLDTFHVDYRIFIRTDLPFGDFLPSTIESKQCMILDLSNHKQNLVIKINGTKQTGQMTAVGSSFYFIQGSAKYFLSKMDRVN